MWWSRRRRVPWWLALLALIGLKAVVRGAAFVPDERYQSRRARFWTKIGEAFEVWREPEDEEPAESEV